MDSRKTVQKELVRQKGVRADRFLKDRISPSAECVQILGSVTERESMKVSNMYRYSIRDAVIVFVMQCYYIFLLVSHSEMRRKNIEILWFITGKSIYKTCSMKFFFF